MSSRYKTFKVTAEVLRALHACEDGLNFFNRYFPDGVTISNCQEEMDELVAELWSALQDNGGKDYQIVMFVNWFCFTSGGRTGYNIADFNSDYPTELSWCGAALSDLPLFKD